MFMAKKLNYIEKIYTTWFHSIAKFETINSKLKSYTNFVTLIQVENLSYAIYQTLLDKCSYKTSIETNTTT